MLQRRGEVYLSLQLRKLPERRLEHLQIMKKLIFICLNTCVSFFASDRKKPTNQHPECCIIFSTCSFIVPFTLLRPLEAIRCGSLGWLLPGKNIGRNQSLRLKSLLDFGVLASLSRSWKIMNAGKKISMSRSTFLLEQVPNQQQE